LIAIVGVFDEVLACYTADALLVLGIAVIAATRR
jgi:hypothetical protein